MSIRCCLCGRFIGYKEFESKEIGIDSVIEMTDIYGGIKEDVYIYHKGCDIKEEEND